MRILVVAVEYPPSPVYGAGRYAHELNRALAKAPGVEVHVLCCGGNGRPNCRHEDGVVVHPAECALPVRATDWVGGTVLENVPVAAQACEVVRDHGPFDAVCIHDWVGALAGRAVTSAFGLPTVFFVHHTEAGRNKNRLTRPELYAAELEAWASEWAQAIVVPSASIREELHGIYRIPRQKVAAIRPGVAREAFEFHEELESFRSVLADPDQAIVLYVGRLSVPKGPDVLIEAMQQVGEQHPEAKLVVAGDGELRARLAKRAEEIGLAALFAGYLEGRALAATYRCADVVVVPGRYESAGTTAMEAMACGRPLVISDVSCLRDIAPEGAGLRVSPGDPHALANAICRILDDPGVARKMGETASTHAASFTWALAASRVRRILERLCQGHA